MARYTGPACKICRRENQKLFLKGDRCMTEKCAFERRPYPPGQHGHGRIKFSEYAMQLREKQKLKRTYGLQEGQFHGYFVKAETMKGVTGSNLLTLLERRLDNVIYRSGFATSRAQARIMVRHGHLVVNGKKVSIPSFLIRKGDQVTISAAGQKQVQFQAAIESSKSKEMPNWLDVDRDQFKSVVKDLPTREDITMPIEERMVVELYSK
jgi:small subunit ribosomal protein S4